MTRRQRAAYRLWHGSIALTHRLGDRACTWVRTGPTRVHRVVRLLLLLLGLYLLARIVRSAPALLWAITGVWCWRVWRASPAPVEAPTKAAGEPDVEAVRTLLFEHIGDRQGAHLAAVLTHLHGRGLGEGWTVADLRSRLEALGIPVRRSVKVAGRVAYGVHRDDLSAPSPAPSGEAAA